ncbi:MAG: dTDP-4-dehydrorhamnose 3,5-epimerase [Anaerolineae bacterium]|nr:dTDP-4-dehydrorhamnose 3,5-epimerase [Phycisphaerae bacterium]
MRYTPTPLAGAFVLDLEKIEDSRGYFSYMFNSEEARQHGLHTEVLQIKLSSNIGKGTLRGLHLQLPPAQESKLLRCIRGAIYDVIVDLRKDSPTYLQHFAVELSNDNHRALYVPPMFAHGYQTLTDDAEVMYQVDRQYSPAHEMGLRYDDPALNIRWPIPVTKISEKDKAWPLLDARGRRK